MRISWNSSLKNVAAATTVTLNVLAVAAALWGTYLASNEPDRHTSHKEAATGAIHSLTYCRGC